jgi:hypothetical protein
MSWAAGGIRRGCDRLGKAPEGLVIWLSGTNGTETRCYFKNKAEKLLKTRNRHPKTNRNKPKNKAEKLLKTRSCGKNKAKNKAGHVVENR